MRKSLGWYFEEVGAAAACAASASLETRAAERLPSLWLLLLMRTTRGSERPPLLVGSDVRVLVCATRKGVLQLVARAMLAWAC